LGKREGLTASTHERVAGFGETCDTCGASAAPRLLQRSPTASWRPAPHDSARRSLVANLLPIFDLSSPGSGSPEDRFFFHVLGLGRRSSRRARPRCVPTCSVVRQPR